MLLRGIRTKFSIMKVRTLKEESKSNYKVMICDVCKLNTTAAAAGKYYVHTVRKEHIFSLFGICCKCKNSILIPIAEPKIIKGRMRLNTGRVLHCLHNIYKVYTTKDRIILQCATCGVRVYYDRN